MSDEIESHYQQVQVKRKGEPLGPSSANKCFRQAAYSYWGIPPSDSVSTDAADLGSMIHAGYSAIIAANYDSRDREPDVEIDVPGLPRTGTADDVDWAGLTVTDVKTANGLAWQAMVNRDAPYASYLDQLNIYAYGLHDKHPYEWSIRVLLINRDNGKRAEWTYPADLERGKELVTKIAERHEALLESIDVGLVPEDFPQEGRGPGTGMPCDWCPWLTRCWPPALDASLTPQSEQAAGDPVAIEMHARAYVEASIGEQQHKKDREAHRSFLMGHGGIYGEFQVKTVGGEPREWITDVEKAERLLAEADIEIPKRPAGNSPRYVKVSRLK